MENKTKIICPLCGNLLINNNKNYKCINNHNFDIARQGYINLLPVQNKKSLNPGDSKEMLISRRLFLEKGWYKEICDKVISAVQNAVTGITLPVIADIGCGEGYYTQKIHNTVHNSKCIGIDISKEGVKSACNRDKNIDWIVATASHIPLADNSVNVITAIFALFTENEFLRILKNGGYAVEVTAANEHLIELKSIIYDELFKQDKKPCELSDNFETISCDKHSFKITLNNEDLKLLLKMTPHFWRIRQEKREELENIENLELTVAFWLRTVRKKPSAVL